MYEDELNDLLDYLDAINDAQRGLLDAINDQKEACNA